MKPAMHIDSELRKTHLVPIHPEIGAVWSERLEDLIYWSAQLHDADFREQAEIKLTELRNGVEFREQPYVCEFHYVLGKAAAENMREMPPRTYGCHPDTWAAMDDATKAHFDPFDVDEWRKKLFA